MAVFVVDKKGKPLMPCTEKRARVHRRVPFVIRLTDRRADDCAFQPLRIKLDPGSKTTGIALVRGTPECGVAVLNLFELVHRGRQIAQSLTQRRAFRRRRRGANLRYRAPRFRNRRRPAGSLAPSLRHRVDTTMAWVRRISRWAPAIAISTELVRFDLQAMQNPDIEGSEYQQGELAGYELREYLLEKWGRCCAYCGAKDVPLQIEHIPPKVQGRKQPCGQSHARLCALQYGERGKGRARVSRQAISSWPRYRPASRPEPILAALPCENPAASTFRPHTASSKASATSIAGGFSGLMAMGIFYNHGP